MKRVEIGIFGRMNAGKSTLMNLLTQQETSIVDPTPGTTADHKITLFELHGIGPCKIFDTPGIDEETILGQKKRKKVIQTLRECDLAIITTPSNIADFSVEEELISLAQSIQKTYILVHNIFDSTPQHSIKFKEVDTSIIKEANLSEENSREAILPFIKKYITKTKEHSLLPFIKKDHSYVLIIPMDEETPEKRLLRPQSMAVEEITRNWAYSITYRMDLKKARAGNIEEKRRFDNLLNHIPFLDAVITDSQAMDIVSRWTPKQVQLTTFSIMMIQHGTQRLSKFYQGVNTLTTLKENGKILICEACNHSRIQEDIGTVQIPNILKKRYPNITIDHSFGREFEDKNLQEYDLIIHCGGCMISAQKLTQRVVNLEVHHIPITNYGIFLSWIQGQEVLERVVKPWI
ncbi:50S ribosome-binding GTPase [Halosquirtibacter laminarini]|uniref:50S ribosome-binding GTPase n=1 Tax=Halosquirtibacter laminarini TaxID=3374600 RepID=A0AC61NBW0_9BACT|nr:50S ribosome-binding GTPase [Prolixibacteraceae bacterium]